MSINNCKCLTCGKEFYKQPSYIKRGEGKYCSRKCYGIAISKTTPSKLVRYCKICDKPFNTTSEKVTIGCGNYCSHRCANISRQTRFNCVCRICGKTAHKTLSQITRGNGTYCSRKCKGLAHSHTMSGKNNPHWKGGLSFGKYCPKFNKAFKRKVREFFNRRCVLCGKSEAELGYRLAIHHVDYEKDNCCNGTLDPLFVPLCKSHHSMTNQDREEWELYFRYYLALGYDNQCF